MITLPGYYIIILYTSYSSLQAVCTSGKMSNNQENVKDAESQATSADDVTALSTSEQKVKISDARDFTSKELPPPYAGMGKEMVLHHSGTPGWKRARKILLLVFWGSWVALLGSVIYITVTHPRCKLRPSMQWWQKTSFYHIYPATYLDSDGDGSGDLNGIKSKLDYIKGLHVETIWLGAFYKSPLEDYGYDVSDYRDVDGRYGSLEDFDGLLEQIHAEGLKLVIDFIPNHSSDKHTWFERSVARDPLYDNYYIWRDCGTQTNLSLPNNWLSISGDPAWTYHPIRGQCYFHQYLPSMPDLNLRNEDVRVELDNILRYWLDRGVDGVKVDSADRLFEDLYLRDEVSTNPSAVKDYDSLHHNMTRNQPEVLDMLNRWRGVLDSYGSPDRIMVTDTVGSPGDLKDYYGKTRNGGAHLPLNHELVQVTNVTNGIAISELISGSLDNLPESSTIHWMLGEQNGHRVASRVGLDKLDILHMLLLLLPGVPTSYYGDEIGMTSASSSTYLNRGLSRSVMQWNPDYQKCSGFSTNCSNILVNPSAATYNVQNETVDLSSHLTVFRNLTELRLEDTFVYGEFAEHIVTENIYSFRRYFDGMDTYLVSINAGDIAETVDMSTKVVDGSTQATVVALTGNVTEYSLDQEVDLSEIKLSPGQGVVVSWPYVIKQYL
ncbi:SLC3A1 [Bugula neritina]|uniref:SLC3A1 n=1 Tax=Bugula neritina TaxID=10212 RepID=A0A7J7KJY7_BUGNE|nr:SLC3A1 [Bugula neritina]